MGNPADVELERRDAGPGAGAGTVAIAWLNRPQMLNAFRSQTFDRLHEVLDQVRSDAAIRALILAGRGRAFCAGEDLVEMGEAVARGFNVRAALAMLVRLQGLTRKLVDYPKPVIAAINGPAVGLGAELPLACDARLAASSAYFYYPEAWRGMLQTNGTFHLLPALVGHGRAAEWLLTARRIAVEEALAAGLVSVVVPEEQRIEAAVALARTMS